MQINAESTKPQKAICDFLVVSEFLDKKSQFTDFFKAESFEPKKGSLLVVNTQGKIPAKRLCFVGFGESKDLTLDLIRNSMSKAAQKAISLKAKKLAVSLDHEGLQAADVAQAVAEGLILGSYKFLGYHKKQEKRFAPSSATILASTYNLKEANTGAYIGSVLAEAENNTRDLVNSPSNIRTPQSLADHAKALAKHYKIKCEILDPHKEGFECMWAVAKGSKIPPKVIVMKYNGAAKKSKELIALIGKGITFDSGGISIKPAVKMWEMKGDMAGAAAVIEAMAVIAKLKIKKNIIAVVPLAENMPDGGALKPGDIVGSLDGTTVEIISTDAEGRMLLADAVTYAKQLGATKIFDCATLTGGCITALGDVASGLLGNNIEFIEEIEEASDKSGQKVWHLPIFEEYRDYLKSDVADIKNCMDKGMASASTGAVFIEKFVGNVPWVHLDIAGTAFLDKNQGPYCPWATGVPLRLIVEWLRK